MAGLASLSAGAREALRTGHRARVVRHARLLPTLAEDAAQMRFTLEDALNTADFGDCGRLIVVRRLRLRGLPRLAGSTLVAQALEEAWKALAPSAVSHRDARAARADVVYFASRFEARLAWLETRVTGRQTDAWFWRAAVPELSRASAPEDTGRCIDAVVLALLQESAGQTMTALRESSDDALIVLAGELFDATGQLLLETLTATTEVHQEPPAAPREPDATPARTMATRLWQPVMARLKRDTSRSAPTPWLAALWLEATLGQAPTSAQVAALVAGVASGPTPDAATPRSDLGDGPMPPYTPDFNQLAPQSAASALAANRLSTSWPADAAAPDARGPPPPGGTAAHTGVTIESDLPRSRRQATPAGAARHASALPWLDNALPTTHGGLLLAVNVLHELRFETWLDVLPQAARQPFANALLAHLLHALHCAPDEPQLAWFNVSDVAAPEALRTWTLRMRRFLRRHTGMDLGALVLRPAWVCATPTHADVIFALDQTDLRLRRLGLDRDPGWVPWLGRIVSFHFLAHQLLPESAPSPGFARPPEGAQENLGAARRFLVEPAPPDAGQHG